MKDYIKVPFQDKDKVKELGARWDKEMKSWYITDDMDQSKFSQWTKHDPLTSLSAPGATRIYLNVPYGEKDEAKRVGARWDSEKKQWYFMSDKDNAVFSKWLDSGNEQPKEQKKKDFKDVNNLDDELDDILNIGD